MELLLNLLPDLQLKFIPQVLNPIRWNINIIYSRLFCYIRSLFFKKRLYKNTEINGLYINDNITLICKIKDDIEFSSDGAYIELKNIRDNDSWYWMCSFL